MTLFRCLRRVWHRRAFLCSALLCLAVYYSGLLMYLGEKDYRTQFVYPLELPEGQLGRLVGQLREKRRVDVKPVNLFQHEFVSDSAHRCRDELLRFEAVRLLFVVKSAVEHFERRDAIRRSWGWTERFSDVQIRCVFLLGVDPQRRLQARVDDEQIKHADLVQARFVDAYYNNTVKTLMGFHWAVTNCPKAQFVMFVDDDYYVSAKNVLRFLRRPGHYPRYLQRAFLSVARFDEPEPETESRRSMLGEPERKIPSATPGSRGVDSQRSPHRAGANSKPGPQRAGVYARIEPKTSAATTPVPETLTLPTEQSQNDGDSWTDRRGVAPGPQIPLAAALPDSSDDKSIKGRHPSQRSALSVDDFAGPELKLPAPPDSGGGDSGDSEGGGLDKTSSDASLYTGFVFPSSKPHRVITSAWHVTLEEYPFDRYPPYVTAGAYLVSFAALQTLYYASFYTVPFRFDDVYVGILAKKAGVRPLHNPNFYFYKQPYSKTAYAYLIASHGYGDPEELAAVWNEQRTLGNA